MSSSSMMPAYQEAHGAPGGFVLRWEAASNRKVAAGLLVLGVLGTGATLIGAFTIDRHAGFASYLVGFSLFLALALGSLFFVMLQHLTTSRWSVTVRRIAEASMATLPLFAILFVPIALGMHDLYVWTHADHVQESAILQHKAAWLNEPFFLIRAAIYLAIWIVLSQILWRGSLATDSGGAAGKLSMLRKVCAPGMLLFALSLSFAAFDWLMSMQPHWYSTIFGVYYFAGGVQGMFALLILLSLYLQRGGMLQGAITVEHYHDLGKFTFGFTVFFAYIAFSQYLLMWYANIPEETEFYLHRWGPWAGLSWALIFVTFVIPFLTLISRAAKRTMSILATGAVIVLLGRVIDISWLVLPAMDHDQQGPHLTWMFFTAIGGIGCLYLGLTAWLLGRHPLVPVGDPFLPNSLRHENV